MGIDGIPTFDRLDSLYIIRSFEGGTSTTGSLAFTKVHSYDTEIAVIAQKFEQRIRKSTVAKTSLRPSIKIVDAYRDDYVLSPPKTTEALLAELKDEEIVMKSFHDDLADELDIDMLGLSTSDNESMLEDLYGSDC